MRQLTLSVGVAIMHYYLWDIYILINRTLVYGTLTDDNAGVGLLRPGKEEKRESE